MNGLAHTPLLPATSPSGELMQAAGKYARNAVLTAFDMIGGVNALAEWGRANKTDFYTKVFTKTITREVDVKDERSVEDLLALLDKADAIPAVQYSVVPEPMDVDVEAQFCEDEERC